MSVTFRFFATLVSMTVLAGCLHSTPPTSPGVAIVHLSNEEQLEFYLPDCEENNGAYTSVGVFHTEARDLGVFRYTGADVEPEGNQWIALELDSTGLYIDESVQSLEPGPSHPFAQSWAEAREKRYFMASAQTRVRFGLDEVPFESGGWWLAQGYSTQGTDFVTHEIDLESMDQILEEFCRTPSWELSLGMFDWARVDA